MDDTTTDRCESCGHPRDAWCDDECCWWKGERFNPGSVYMGLLAHDAWVKMEEARRDV